MANENWTIDVEITARGDNYSDRAYGQIHLSAPKDVLSAVDLAPAIKKAFAKVLSDLADTIAQREKEEVSSN